MNAGELDDELRQAKAHPFKVQLEFDRRFRVWQSIIHRNRFHHLNTSPITVEGFESLKERYSDLDKLDAARLERRAQTEFGRVLEATLDTSLVIKHYNVLRYRQIIIADELKWQLSRYERAAEKWFKPHSYIYEHLNNLIGGNNHGT